MKAIAHIKLLMALLLPSFSCIAQNLVPNYSFEDTLSCDIPLIYNVPPWFTTTADGSPDYFNPCEAIQMFSAPYNSLGYQLARTGVAYVGLIAATFVSPPLPPLMCGNILKWL